MRPKSHVLTTDHVTVYKVPPFEFTSSPIPPPYCNKMQVLVDMRYVVLPLINLIIWVLIHQPKPYFDNPMFVMAFMFLAIAILLFLFVSVTLPLILSVEPLRLRAGHFSVPLTLALLASVFLPSSRFCYVFPTLVILSPWYEMLLDLFKCFISWFRDALQAPPALIITCITQRLEVDQVEAIVIEGNNEVELEAIVVEGNNEANI